MLIVTLQKFQIVNPKLTLLFSSSNIFHAFSSLFSPLLISLIYIMKLHLILLRCTIYVFTCSTRFFNNLTYFALFLMSSTLSGSLYLNYFLNCAAELPSAIFIYFYIDRWVPRMFRITVFSFEVCRQIHSLCLA